MALSLACAKKNNTFQKKCDVPIIEHLKKILSLKRKCSTVWIRKLYPEDVIFFFSIITGRKSSVWVESQHGWKYKDFYETLEKRK